MMTKLEEIKQYILSLESESFIGWTEDSINGYLTACESIKQKIDAMIIKPTILFPIRNLLIESNVAILDGNKIKNRYGPDVAYDGFSSLDKDCIVESWDDENKILILKTK